MDMYERELCRLFRDWLPFGGPPDDLVSEFGIPRQRASAIVRSLVEDVDSRHLRSADREVLNALRSAQESAKLTRR